MKVHPIYPIMFFVLLALYAFVMVLAYWAFWPYPTIVFKDLPPSGAPVLNSPLYPGDALQYQLSFCKNTDTTATLHRYLVDGQIVTLTDITGAFPMGCQNNKIVSTTVIPDTANSGTYHLDVVDEFHPNPIRWIQVRYRTADFTVIPKPKTLKTEINGVPAIINVKSSTTTSTSTI